MKKVFVVFGTRPEAIKMAPVIHSMERHPQISVVTCLSGQHKEMLEPVMSFFNLDFQYQLNVMDNHPSLSRIYSRVIAKLEPVFQKEKPDLIMVHGDTATTTAASMAAFFQQIPLAHIEAGLRTGNLYSPWPEEFNRRVTGLLTKYHFAPTTLAKKNLLNEGVPEKAIHITGNTIIDALFYTLDKLSSDESYKNIFYKNFPFINKNKRLVLVTGHRRENFGDGLSNICQALIELSSRGDIDIVYPVHLNPQVSDPVHKILNHRPHIHLIDPLSYKDFIFLLKNSYLVITDSGGIQEEAPSLGIPVLLTRDTTERPEAIEAGSVKLVGTSSEKIIMSVNKLLDDRESYDAISKVQNIYGDGHSSERIVQGILNGV